MSWFDSVSDRIKDFGGIAIDNFKGGFKDANSMFDAARDHISEGRILDGAGSVAVGMGAATANVLTAGGAHAIGDEIAKSGKLDGLFDALNETKPAKGMFTSLAENVKRSVEDIQSRIQEHKTATPITDAFKAGFESVADTAKRVGENVHEHAEASPIIDAFKNAVTGAAAGAVASAANKGRGGEFNYIQQSADGISVELGGK